MYDNHELFVSFILTFGIWQIAKENKNRIKDLSLIPMMRFLARCMVLFLKAELQLQ
nr:MAG TPA: hypothetical protein [Caudoviricetes sp.]